MGNQGCCPRDTKPVRNDKPARNPTILSRQSRRESRQSEVQDFFSVQMKSHVTLKPNNEELYQSMNPGADLNVSMTKSLKPTVTKSRNSALRKSDMMGKLTSLNDTGLFIDNKLQRDHETIVRLMAQPTPWFVDPENPDKLLPPIKLRA